MLAVEEALGRFGLWVRVASLACQRNQARDLVLTPLRVSRTTSLSFRSPLVATTIDFDSNRTRRVGNLHLELACAVSFGLFISLGDQLGPDGFGQSPDVPTADREVGQESEGLGSQLERRERSSRVNDLGEYRRAVAMRIKLEGGPLGGKNPFDKRGSERQVLAA